MHALNPVHQAMGRCLAEKIASVSVMGIPDRTKAVLTVDDLETIRRLFNPEFYPVLTVLIDGDTPESRRTLSGEEKLPAAVTAVRFGSDTSDPSIAVDAAWTLNRLYHACEHAVAFAVAEKNGQAAKAHAALEALSGLGAVTATVRDRKILKALYDRYPFKQVSFEEYCDSDKWLFTNFRFDETSGLLEVFFTLDI